MCGWAVGIRPQIGAHAQTDRRLLASPDSQVSARVDTVLRSLRSLAQSCVQSEGNSVTMSRLGVAERAFVDLRAALEPWGLKP